MNISIVDSSTSLVSLLNDLENQSTSPPSLYLDIEGIKLSRYGSISIIQLFHLPLNRVFLIDVFVLQDAAFDTSNLSGTSLRSIFESPTIPKVFFDVRNDSDALFGHYNISLQNVHDIQLLEVATRSRSKDRVAGLRKCIECDARLSVEAKRKWRVTKEKGLALFSEQGVASYAPFNSRPMLQDVIDYCAQDVIYLPILWMVYSKKISEKWLQRVQEETRRRVSMSQTESYDPHGKHKVWSPWAKTVKEGIKNGSRESIRKRVVRNEVTVVGETMSRKKPTAAEISAAKALQRKAEKQLPVELTLRSPAKIIKPRASKPFADFPASQTSLGIGNTTLECSSLQTHLPTRSKGVTNATAVAMTDTKMSSTTADNEWTCTACSRKMLKSQQQDHLAGKAHINRLKQMSSVVNTTTASTPRQKKTHPSRSARSKNRNLTDRAVGTFSSQPSELYENPDWGFVGFGQSTFAKSYGYEEYRSGKGDDFGLCDKDCGWCGHCMDNVDI